MPGSCWASSGNGWRRMSSRIGVTLVVTLALAGCDSLLPGAPPDGDVLEGPVDGLSNQQSAAFAAGDREFARRFGTIDGLGPIFVAPSCESCHIGDGKGHLSFNLKRFGRM